MNEQLLKEGRDKYGRDFIGSVIRILDKTTIIINVGKLDSVSIQEGNTIQVYCRSENIKDTDGSDLGILKIVKDSLEVIQVEDHYSICKKDETEEYSYPNLITSPLLTGVRKVPLNVDDNDISPLKGIDKKVRLGDPVRRA